MNLNYYVDKPCTILTNSLNRSFIKNGAFDEMQFSEYFTGFVKEVDSYGIWMQHPATGSMSYFLLNNIVGIIEEQVKSADDPIVEKAINQIKASKDDTYKSAQIISLESLEATAKKVQGKYKSASLPGI